MPSSFNTTHMKYRKSFLQCTTYRFNSTLTVCIVWPAKIKTIKLPLLFNFIYVLISFSITMKTVAFVLNVCLLVHICTGCSVWNHGRPCRCACEDANTYCRKK